MLHGRRGIVGTKPVYARWDCAFPVDSTHINPTPRGILWRKCLRPPQTQTDKEVWQTPQKSNAFLVFMNPYRETTAIIICADSAQLWKTCAWNSALQWCMGWSEHGVVLWNMETSWLVDSPSPRITQRWWVPDETAFHWILTPKYWAYIQHKTSECSSLQVPHKEEYTHS